VRKGAAFVVLALAAVALMSFVAMSLWNQLIPRLFGGPSLHFWQAAGLLVLSRIFVGGLRGHGIGRHGPWRQHMWRERWESMTPEERERLRERFKHRCGGGPADQGAEQEQPKP
jgi:hypothetical protein